MTILIAIILVLAIVCVYMYNSLVRGLNLVEEAFSTMDVYLKKRYDLIPNLVATVKSYAKHEADTLVQVVSARNERAPLAQRVEQERAVGESLRQLLVRLEAYPELKANANYLNLQEQLGTVESELERARRYYNGTVRQQNDRVMTVPHNIFAKLFGFGKMPYFQAEEGDRKNVDVAGAFGVK